MTDPAIRDSRPLFYEPMENTDTNAPPRRREAIIRKRYGPGVEEATTGYRMPESVARQIEECAKKAKEKVPA